jgi:phosphomannomutase
MPEIKDWQLTRKWKKLYADDLTKDEKEKIICALQEQQRALFQLTGKTWGETIEDRGSQITWSALGQHDPLKETVKWDADFAIQKKLKIVLDSYIPGFSIRLGGATAIDITKPGSDKAYGIKKLRDILEIPIKEMICVGDALFPEGNDYPAERAGVISIPIQVPNETKRSIETIMLPLRTRRAVWHRMERRLWTDLPHAGELIIRNVSY